MVCAVGNASKLGGLADVELRGLLDDESLSLARQLEVLDELSRRALARRKAEETAELVAAVPVMAALDDSAEMVRKAQAQLDRAKQVRAEAVRAALAEGYSVRTVAEVARVAPSTALRLGSEDLAGEPSPP